VQTSLKLGAMVDDGVVKLTLSDHELFSAYEDYFDLLMIICKWRTVKAYYEDKPVHLYRFILKYKFVFDCASERHESGAKYCWQAPHMIGWGCSKLKKISRYIRDGVRNYYEFGSFNDKVWRIDKITLIDKLKQESKSSGCHLCPYFDFDNVVEIVNHKLPESLIDDDIFFVRDQNMIKHKLSLDEINKKQMQGVLSKLASYGFSRFAMRVRPGSKFFEANEMYNKYEDGYINNGVSLN
jgi:hypothetical protein